MNNQITYSEKSISDILNRKFLSSPKYVINNLFVFGWESDYLALTASGYWYEIEIKISRSDYLADFNKKDKHSVLSSKDPNRKPNYFYYAVPEGLVSIEEIPDYAGLVYISGIHLEVIKPAPKIHSQKLDIDLQDKFYYNWKNEIHKNKNHIKDKEKFKESFKQASFWQGYLNGEVNACSEMLGIIKGYLKEDHPIVLEMEEFISEKDIALKNTNAKVTII